jgi:hypothetical protein
MSRVTIDLRQPEGELPPLDFTLSDTEWAIARCTQAELNLQREERNERDAKREAIAAQQIQQNEKDQTKQG